MAEFSLFPAPSLENTDCFKYWVKSKPEIQSVELRLTWAVVAGAHCGCFIITPWFSSCPGWLWSLPFGPFGGTRPCCHGGTSLLALIAWQGGVGGGGILPPLKLISPVFLLLFLSPPFHPLARGKDFYCLTLPVGSPPIVSEAPHTCPWAMQPAQSHAPLLVLMGTETSEWWRSGLVSSFSKTVPPCFRILTPMLSIHLQWELGSGHKRIARNWTWHSRCVVWNWYWYSDSKVLYCRIETLSKDTDAFGNQGSKGR